MAPKRCTVKLQKGDIVSAAVYSWGRDYAKSRGDKGGRSEEIRDEGVVVEAKGPLWVVKFDDDSSQIAWKRNELRFVSRPGAMEPVRASQRSRPQARAAVEDSSSEGEQPGPEDEAEAAHDSSEEDEQEEEPQRGRVGSANHAMPVQESDGGWVQDDDYSVDERAKHGHTSQQPPMITNMDEDHRTAGLLTYALHFLPRNYLEDMAAEMTEKGRKKGEEGDRHTARRFSSWNVTVDDVTMWIGVWMYMLAFPQQASSRRSYFQAPLGGFGPAHNLTNILILAGKGHRGLAWFETMQSCFSLPRWQRTTEGREHGHKVERSQPYSQDDPFAPTRRFWDHLRTAFYFAVAASWLLCLDESMVQWTGRGMPGLMVILRKPTPIGLELHTLCCALCGVLCWFEVYEGKEPMAKKPFNDKYPKSIALSLRMLQPFFGTVRL